MTVERNKTARVLIFQNIKRTILSALPSMHDWKFERS